MRAAVIRDAELADMAALGAVFRRSSLSNEGDRDHLLDHPEVLALSGQAVDEGRTRVAVAGGTVVGFASWCRAGDVFEIEDLFVDPAYMRKGIARALVDDLAAIASRAGARRVEVTANPHALGFYAKAGFVADREVATQFGPGTRMHADLTR